jgi:hypothetical protein
MVKLNNVTEKTWWIAMSTDKTIIHEGELLPNMELVSGQDELETFSDEQSWLNRLKELGVDQVNKDIEKSV